MKRLRVSLTPSHPPMLPPVNQPTILCSNNITLAPWVGLVFLVKVLHQDSHHLHSLVSQALLHRSLPYQAVEECHLCHRICLFRRQTCLRVICPSHRRSHQMHKARQEAQEVRHKACPSHHLVPFPFNLLEDLQVDHQVWLHHRACRHHQG